jgi:hypothetical protein
MLTPTNIQLYTLHTPLAWKTLIGKMRFSLISGFHSDINDIALFWDITQRRVVIIYRRFGTTYGSHLQGSRSPKLGLLDP